MAPDLDPGSADVAADLVWVYWKFYPSSTGESDAAILSTLKLIHGEVRPVLQWHFLRIIDLDGFHIRFRFLAPRESADAAVSPFARLSQEVSDSQTGDWRPIRAHPEQPLAARRRRSLQWRTYVPELNKWGTGESLRQAHSTFTASSRFAADALYVLGDARDRSLVAMALLSSVVDSLPLQGEAPAAFLQQHASWWDPRGSLAQLNESDTATMSRVLRRLDAPPTQVLSAIEAARLHGAEIAHASLHAGGERSPLYFAHQHAHLAINRLGIHGTDESWVSHLVQITRRQHADRDGRDI